MNVVSLRVLWVLPFCLGFLLGCENVPGTAGRAQALVKLRRDAVDGNSSDFMVYKETQAALLKSDFVINAALRDQNIASIKGVSPTSVDRALAVHVGETEVMSVWLSQGSWTKKETEKILNAVVESYLREIVNKERVDKVDQLAKMRRRYQQAYQMVTKKGDEVMKLAEQLGVVDETAIAARVEIIKSKIRHLDVRLIDAQLAKIDVGDDEVASNNAQQKIDFVGGEIESLNEELGKFSAGDGNLIARKEDLKALQKDMHRLRDEMIRLEAEIDGPAPVEVISAARIEK